MNPNWDHNEGRPPSMVDVKDIMSRLQPALNYNEDVLAIDQHAQMRARGRNFPREMYHAELDPVLCMNKIQYADLVKIGYSEHYEFREYPKMIFRRNMDKRFALQPDPMFNPGSGQSRADQYEFVESRTVKSRKDP